MTALSDLSAVALCDLIRTRRISPVEVLDAVLARISAVNPHLNAIVQMREKAARAEAEAAQEALSQGAATGLLHGLPIGVKESMNVSGMLTTQGSPIYAGNRATHDDTIITKLRNEGAVVLAKALQASAGDLRARHDHRQHAFRPDAQRLRSGNLLPRLVGGIRCGAFGLDGAALHRLGHRGQHSRSRRHQRGMGLAPHTRVGRPRRPNPWLQPHQRQRPDGTRCRRPDPVSRRDDA